MELKSFNKIVDVRETVRRTNERETEVGYYFAIEDGTLTLETDTGTYELQIETHIAKVGAYTVSDISGPQFDKKSLKILIEEMYGDGGEISSSSGFFVGLFAHLPLEDMAELLEEVDEEYLIEDLPELFPEKVQG